MLNFIKKIFGGEDKSAEILELLADGAMIIDARTPAEYHSGHVRKAVNYPVQTLSSHIANIKKENKPVIAYCQSGMRSASAVAMLKNAGIQAVNAGSISAMEKILKK